MCRYDGYSSTGLPRKCFSFLYGFTSLYWYGILRSSRAIHTRWLNGQNWPRISGPYRQWLYLTCPSTVEYKRLRILMLLNSIGCRTGSHRVDMFVRDAHGFEDSCERDECGRRKYLGISPKVLVYIAKAGKYHVMERWARRNGAIRSISCSWLDID